MCETEYTCNFCEFETPTLEDMKYTELCTDCYKKINRNNYKLLRKAEGLNPDYLEQKVKDVLVGVKQELNSPHFINEHLSKFLRQLAKIEMFKQKHIKFTDDDPDEEELKDCLAREYRYRLAEYAVQGNVKGIESMLEELKKYS